LTKARDVVSFLRLREGDEIYTAMAVAEVLAEWHPKDAGLATRARNDYADAVESTYGDDERLGLGTLSTILQAMNTLPTSGMQLARDVLGRGSLFERVAAVRAVVRNTEKLPQQSIELLSMASQDKHRYVRRAVARDKHEVPPAAVSAWQERRHGRGRG